MQRTTCTASDARPVPTTTVRPSLSWAKKDRQKFAAIERFLKISIEKRPLPDGFREAPAYRSKEQGGKNRGKRNGRGNENRVANPEAKAQRRKHHSRKHFNPQKRPANTAPNKGDKGGQQHDEAKG